MTKKAETKTDKMQFLNVVLLILFIFLIFLAVGLLSPILSILATIGFAVFVFWCVGRFIFFR